MNTFKADTLDRTYGMTRREYIDHLCDIHPDISFELREGAYDHPNLWPTVTRAKIADGFEETHNSPKPKDWDDDEDGEWPETQMWQKFKPGEKTISWGAKP